MATSIPIQILQDYLRAAVYSNDYLRFNPVVFNDPDHTSLGSQIHRMKRSKFQADEHLFSGFMRRYVDANYVRLDTGNFYTGAGQAYEFGNDYLKNAEDLILPGWEDLLGIDFGLRRHRNRQIAPNAHENLAAMQQPEMRRLMAAYLIMMEDNIHNLRPGIVKMASPEVLKLANRLLDPAFFAEQFKKLIDGHRLSHEDIVKIVKAQEFWHKSADGWFEFFRYANYIRFLIVFAEIPFEFFQAAGWLIVGSHRFVNETIKLCNHPGFTQLSFAIYVVQMLMMLIEFALIARATIINGGSLGEAFKNYWGKPGKLSDFVNAFFWCTVGLIAFLHNHLSTSLFIIGFIFDAIHVTVFWLKSMVYDKRHRIKQRERELHGLVPEGHNEQQWLNRLRALVHAHRATFKQQYKRLAKLNARLAKLDDEIADIQRKLEAAKYRVAYLQLRLQTLQDEKADKEGQKRLLEEQVSGELPFRDNGAGLDIDLQLNRDEFHQAFNAMNEIEKIHDQRKEGMAAVARSWAIGVGLAGGWVLCALSLGIATWGISAVLPPLWGVIGALMMGVGIALFVGFKLHGLRQARKAAKARVDEDSQEFHEIRTRVRAGDNVDIDPANSDATAPLQSQAANRSRFFSKPLREADYCDSDVIQMEPLDGLSDEEPLLKSTGAVACGQ